MRRHGLPVDDFSHDALLIRASGRNNTKSSRVDFPTTVADDVSNLLLAVLTLHLVAILLTQLGQYYS